MWIMKRLERKGFIFKRKGFIKRKDFLLFKNLQKKRKEKKIISSNPEFGWKIVFTTDSVD